MTIKTIEDVDLAEKRVLIRVDFNLPIKDGQVTSDARINAALPTINSALQQGAKVMLLTHLGRPKEGIFDPEASVRPVCDRLETITGHTVRLVSEPFEGVSFESNEIIMFENVRFLKGEKKDDPDLAQTYADLCDVFIMDAFATAHRAQASTHGVAKRAKEACAGKLVAQEVNALTKALHEPERPVVAIVGGSKVSTKLTVLKNLIPKVDVLIPGGGIANTFLKASGYDIGSSMVDNDLLKDTENQLMSGFLKRFQNTPALL
jgi:phosphoglycerate kinase